VTEVPDIDTLVQAALIDLDTDECDLQWMFDRVRRLSPGASHNEIRQSTLRVLGELIGRGLAKPHLLGETYETAKPDEPVLEQIRHGWDRYGERLNMGDVAYFSITAAGRAELRSASQP
jgi:hypothetical protein